jgi:hypothetical protein
MSDEKRYDTGRKSPPEDEEWPRIWRTLDKSDLMYQVFYPVILVAQNWKIMAAVIGLAALMNIKDIVGTIQNLSAFFAAFGASP